MYDVEKLKTPADCRVVMERAQAKGMHDLYAAVFRRLCALEGEACDDPSDPLVRATWEVVGAYEQVLYEKHRKRQPAGRVRQAIANKGVYQSLIDWSKLHGNRDGFRTLVDAGLSEFTFEAVVVRFAERFPPDVVARCRETLKKAGD